MTSEITNEWKRVVRGNPRNAVPGEPAKVAVIIVDRVGSEVPLSGEEGNCVQWR